jgi:hypothetical protein
LASVGLLSAVEQQKENTTVEVLSFPPPWGSTREEVLEDKFAELLAALRPTMKCSTGCAARSAKATLTHASNARTQVGVSKRSLNRYRNGSM